MAQVTALQSVAMRDARGHVGKFRYWYQYDQADPTGQSDAINRVLIVNAAIAACSNAAIIAYNGLGSEQFSPLFYGASAQFENAEDKARMVFLAVDDDVAPALYTLWTIEIPAPKAALFYADLETVNSAATLTAQFITAMLTADGAGGHPVTKSGLLIAQFVGGYRRRRKMQRKLTIYDKSANLDEPEV